MGGPIIEIRHAVHASLFTAFDNEPIWGVHNRILAPQLTKDVVADHFDEVRDIAAELTSKWRGLGDGATLSPFDELNRLDLETTTYVFYGKRLNGLSGPEHPMIQGMNGATGEAVMRPTRPKILNWLKYQSKFNRDSKIMRDYAAECYEYRKKNPTDRKDMLYTMINTKDPETGQSFNDEQIIDEIVTMPIGSSTAPCAIATGLYYLLKNPEHITKAQQEIESVVGDGELTPTHLGQLPYVEAILRETMRLCAPAPGFNIEPRPDAPPGPISLAGGKYQVPEKQPMIIVLHGVHRDPAVFEDPLAFKPERMLNGGFERMPVGAKKWFGNGKRVCIGHHYAKMWAMITLITLLRDTDFEFKDKGYELRQDGWFNVRPVGFEINVKARNK